MEKINLHFNELDLVLRKRVDGIIYSVYISDEDSFINFDSGFNLDDWDFDSRIIVDSLQKASDQLGYERDISSEIILGMDYTDDSGSFCYKHWIYDPDITLIDLLNPYLSTILIHQEENKGIDEDLTPPDLNISESHQGYITQCLENFIESGDFKFS